MTCCRIKNNSRVRGLRQNKMYGVLKSHVKFLNCRPYAICGDLHEKRGKCDNKCDLIVSERSVKDLTKMIVLPGGYNSTMVHQYPRVINFMLIVESSSTCRSV